MSRYRRTHVLAMGWISIVANAALFVFKFWVGSTTGSVAIVADAWHTLSDSLSSGVVLAGAGTARKPADDEHPFGHGRAELIAAVVVGAFLAAVGFNIILESLSQLQAVERVEYGELALIACVVSVVIKEALAQGAFIVARTAGSPALKADAWHHRSDAITSLLIIVGILLGGSHWWIDGVLGVAVALFLLKAAVGVIREGSAPLLGEKPTGSALAQMRSIASRVSPTLGQVHHVHIHRYGDHTELTCHVRMNGDMTVSQAHTVVDDYEVALRDEMNVEPTVHVDPVRQDAGRSERAPTADHPPRSGGDPQPS